MHRSSLIRGRRWSVAALIGLAITIGAVGPALAALPKVLARRICDPPCSGRAGRAVPVPGRDGP